MIRISELVDLLIIKEALSVLMFCAPVFTSPDFEYFVFVLVRKKKWHKLRKVY